MNLRSLLPVAILGGMLAGRAAIRAEPAAAIVLENPTFRLEFSPEGIARSLRHKPSGQECLADGVRIPAFTLTQDRPYLPEEQLAYPARPMAYRVVSLRRESTRGEDRLVADFGPADFEARFRIQITDAYVGLRLEGVRYKDTPKLRSAHPPGWDEMSFLRLPLRPRQRHGEWLNVLWDDDVAVNLLGTSPAVRINGERDYDWHVFAGTVRSDLESENVGAALIVTRPDGLLDAVARAEADYDMPAGVASRRRPEYRQSYYALSRATAADIDRHLEYAKRAGFRGVQVYYPTFSRGAGHFEYRPEFPHGLADIRAMGEKIRAAGFSCGFHIHYNKASKTDPYVRRADWRLNAIRTLTLDADLGADATTLRVNERPRGLTYEEGRRLLRIGSELIEWTSHTSAPPYVFSGLKRGALGTRPAAHPAGAKADALDVDTWPAYVRFDQRTTIQTEVAKRIQELYAALGASFVYFDGAEDVPAPSWYNVAWSQWQVYRELRPEPVYTSGACSAHFSWHMLTRAPGFDIFEPENLKAALRRHHYEKAVRVAQDFSVMDWGWAGYAAPSASSTGTQPDMLEYAAALATGFDGVLSLMPTAKALDAHARTPDNLEVLKRWEDFRLSGRATAAQKAMLRNPEPEHHLLVDESGEPEIVPVVAVPNTGTTARPLHAFTFERGGAVHVLYWHGSAAARMEVRLPASATVRLMDLDRIGSAGAVERSAGVVTLPVDRRRYLEVRGVSREHVVDAFRDARLLP